MTTQAYRTVFSTNIQRVCAAAVFLAALFLVNAPALALDCANPNTQADINICAEEAHQQADKKLNEVYQKALKQLQQDDPSKIERFKDIQRAWIKYRDHHCSYAADLYEGGTMAPGILSMCLTRMTKQRTEEIPSLFDEWQ